MVFASAARGYPPAARNRHVRLQGSRRGRPGGRCRSHDGPIDYDFQLVERHDASSLGAEPNLLLPAGQVEYRARLLTVGCAKQQRAVRDEGSSGANRLDPVWIGEFLTGLQVSIGPHAAQGDAVAV